jgi:hypothetical protein
MRERQQRGLCIGFVARTVRHALLGAGSCILAGTFLFIAPAASAITLDVEACHLAALSVDGDLYIAYTDGADGCFLPNPKVSLIRSGDAASFTYRENVPFGVGVARSRSAPSLAYFGGKFYLAWSTGSSVCVASSGDGLHYGGEQCFSDWSRDAFPSLSVAGGRMFLSAGVGGTAIVRSTSDGVSWDGLARIDADLYGPEGAGALHVDYSHHGSTFAYWNGRYIFATGLTAKMCDPLGLLCDSVHDIRITESFDGVSATTRRLSDTTKDAPRFFALGAKLHLLWAGESERLWRNGSLDGRFPSRNTVGIDESSGSAPALACLNRRMYVVFAGQETNRIHVDSLPALDAECAADDDARRMRVFAGAVVPLLLD